ncbi:MAG: NADH-quinone oxidoreductase subunit NuoH [Deltaproteobacteria bacterium]|nr:NADH-quinone oxidoreductase subunit NuoH [Deltaproteobacteria bacterium]MBW2638644.1 NADH-quinone oxidoreductase subunit NuoH [Deltaproteobacteria bacterium]MBW2681571.1 NADH-quinone oxidoreductase subunit NuoH [Deltaproteobacteria bacterium]
MEIISTLPPELIRMVFAAIIIISFIFLNAIMMGYLERKIAGHVQRRPGPMEVGSHGILQLVVDGVKLVGKELLIPVNVDRTLFRLGPILSFTPVILPLLVIPFSEKLQARDLNLGLLFIVSMTSINVMAMVVAGWGSNNKYSMFGAMRAVAQSIAYEIPILLSMLAVVLMTNTFSLKEIVGAQQNIWFIVLQPLAFIIYIISGVAETNRAPFDLPEAESELTAGFHTEYSGMGFSLFFLGEYTNMFTVASVATVLFLGGWHGPPLPYGQYLGIVWFFLKVYFLLFFMIMIRWTYPRVRFDQLLNFSWKYLVPFSLVNILITAVVVKL